ncbi:MAG: hypothetical protein HGA87_01235 [Desulfobulbaceae bacterium]|nr:hypothetical protein [Desulfobulbaceae bacterium]
MVWILSILKPLMRYKTGAAVFVAAVVLLSGIYIKGRIDERGKWKAKVEQAETKLHEYEVQSAAVSQYWQQWAESEVAKAQKHTANTAQHIESAKPKLDVNGALPVDAVQLFNESVRRPK